VTSSSSSSSSSTRKETMFVFVDYQTAINLSLVRRVFFHIDNTDEPHAKVYYNGSEETLVGLEAVALWKAITNISSTTPYHSPSQDDPTTKRFEDFNYAISRDPGEAKTAKNG
jgi:hypothetical protein